MQPIHEQLRDARRARHLSQKALGARIGLPQSHISDIETGKVDPRLSSLFEIARQLDYEPLLVPRALVPAMQAILSGDPEAPLWQVDNDTEDDL
jgi:transcriptional regulator with XRE-family HTH domain